MNLTTFNGQSWSTTIWESAMHSIEQKYRNFYITLSSALTQSGTSAYTRIDYSRKSKSRILQWAWIQFGSTFIILYISNKHKRALPGSPMRVCAFISSINLNMSKTLAKSTALNYEGKHIPVTGYWFMRKQLPLEARGCTLNNTLHCKPYTKLFRCSKIWKLKHTLNIVGSHA